MLRQLDKAAVKQLLRNPDTKVFRNQMMNLGWWVTVFLPLFGWFTILFLFSLADPDALLGVFLVLITSVGGFVPYVIIVSRRHAIALTREGMFMSHVDTEDYRGPLTWRNLFVRWDEFTQLKLTDGPMMTFRVKGERYAFTVQDPLFVGGSRAKKQQPFVEAICSYSGYIYHFQKGKGRSWQYLFASPGHTFDVEADASDWDSLDCSK